jgi:hypothetical protein
VCDSLRISGISFDSWRNGTTMEEVARCDCVTHPRRTSTTTQKAPDGALAKRHLAASHSEIIAPASRTESLSVTTFARLAEYEGQMTQPKSLRAKPRSNESNETEKHVTLGSKPQLSARDRKAVCHQAFNLALRDAVLPDVCRN